MNDDNQRFRARPGRRHFVCALGVAPALALLGPRAARGQAPAQVRDLRGDVQINGVTATRASAIRAGDTVVTARDGYIVFVSGQDAFMVRGGSELKLERAASGALVEALRLVTGAVGAVFARGRALMIHAPSVTAGIRGTGVYIEARGAGTYFCTCYGAVALAAADDPAQRELIVSGRHTARTIGPPGAVAGRFAPAPFEGHTDAEMDLLERTVGRRSPLVPTR
jgi:hypothetical protein